MNTINEKDLYSLEEYIHYSDIKQIQRKWDYDINTLFDKEVYENILWKIFSEQNSSWINILQTQLHYAKRNRESDELKYFAIYWAKYQEDLMQIYNDIQRCINDIDIQKEELENEVILAYSEKEIAKKEYYNIADKIETLTNNSNFPNIEKTDRNIYIEKMWEIDYSEIEFEDNVKYKCESLLDDMEGWKDDYWKQDEIINDYESLVEITKENYQKVEEFQSDLSDWMYQ